jgi:2,3-bisphosphoglycerate-dependent phosphoglycerate mutase
MTIVFVRHGETALNVARVMQPADTPLNAQGLLQAAAVGRRLAAEPVAAIVSSDLPRARQTAEAIAAATGAPIEYSALLHERNFGDLRGRHHDEVRTQLGYDPITMPGAPPNGESWPVFQQRVASAFAHVLERRRALGGPLVVVTHGLVIGELLDSHVRLPEGAQRPERAGNTSVTIVQAEPPHATELVDCTAHLDARTHDDPNSLSGG